MVGLQASEQATTAAAASRLAIGFTGPPKSRTRKAKRRAAKGARRAPHDIIDRPLITAVRPGHLHIRRHQDPAPHAFLTVRIDHANPDTPIRFPHAPRTPGARRIPKLVHMYNVSAPPRLVAAHIGVL